MLSAQSARFRSLHKRELQDPLALKILTGEFKEGATILVDRGSEGLVFKTGVTVAAGEAAQ